MKMPEGYAYAHRFVDYSAIRDQGAAPRAVLRFIHGIRGHRASAVTLRQIEKYFRSTPPEYIRKVLDRLVEAGCVLMLRSSPSRKRFQYIYDLTNQGCCELYQGTHTDTPWGRQPYIGRDAADQAAYYSPRWEENQ